MAKGPAVSRSSYKLNRLSQFIEFKPQDFGLHSIAESIEFLCTTS